MSYLVTAWDTLHLGPTHNQHLQTMAAVHRLITAIDDQTDCNFVTIRIIRQEPTDVFQLGLPTCGSPTPS